MDTKHFFEMTQQDWQSLVNQLGEPGFRAKQIWEWIYAKHVFTPSLMSNLSKKLKAGLEQAVKWDLPTIIERADSADGASKLLMRSEMQQITEAVILRYDDRVSLCVSSQVGCKMACSFCQTGKLGFFRNLTIGEILGQYAQATQIVEKEGRRISHIVFMGMGEPFDNYDNAVFSANALIDPERFGLSARHVTLSTSGIAPKIVQLAADSRASLAISLHAATDTLRNQLMPLNRKFDLAELKDAMLKYQSITQNKITIEYILIENQNCDLQNAKDLVRYLHGLRVKVNLIPFNSHPGLPHQRPSDDSIRNFQKYLSDRSFAAPVRYSKGLEVSGACGQLAAKHFETLHQAPQRKSVVGKT